MWGVVVQARCARISLASVSVLSTSKASKASKFGVPRRILSSHAPIPAYDRLFLEEVEAAGLEGKADAASEFAPHCSAEHCQRIRKHTHTRKRTHTHTHMHTHTYT